MQISLSRSRQRHHLLLYYSKQAAKVKSGSGEPNRNKVGKVTWSQCKEIAQQKLEDLNAFDLDKAAEMIAGTARSMGLRVIRDK
jgi:large subunit ribosomal protein L11